MGCPQRGYVAVQGMAYRALQQGQKRSKPGYRIGVSIIATL